MKAGCRLRRRKTVSEADTDPTKAMEERQPRPNEIDRQWDIRC
jgi:hypothetical protein